MSVRAPLTGLSGSAPGVLVLPDDVAHYVGRVRRLEVGAEFVAFDPVAGVEADAHIVEAGTHVKVELGAPRLALSAPGPRVTWIQALAKGDKCDAIVQDATELGAFGIVMVASARSVVHLDRARAESRVARWRRIAVEAARQSGRATAPEVGFHGSWDRALAAAPEGTRVLLHPGGEPSTLATWQRALGGADVTVAVGPEGGFTSGEVEEARQAGFRVTSLGPGILRTETVASAVLGGLLLLGGAR